MSNKRLLVEVDIKVGEEFKRLEVTREGHPFDGAMYELRIGDVVKHADPDPHVMIRALGHYIHSLSYQRPLGGV